MSAYQISLLALVAGVFAQAAAAGLAFQCTLSRRLPLASRGHWFVLGCASVLFGLHQARALELALKTGLFDLEQALFAGIASLLVAIALFGLSRRA